MAASISSSLTRTTSPTLWKSNGTAKGTVAVKGGFNDRPFSLTDVNGTLFFLAGSTSISQTELWKTDGTAKGTTLVTTLTVGFGYVDPQSLLSFNGRLFFTVRTDGTGRELWSSDGTAG